ncbi:MAG TPA: cation-translocating P-type ATPase [Acidimicrobiales bacterium]|nr:cation-translocating P-type ATPase [Acidimicrobiales bacterium]
MAMERDHEEAADEAPERVWQSREVQWSAASGLLLAVGFLVEQVAGNETVAVTLWVAATIAGVRFFALEAFEELWAEREVGIELLMTTAAVTAGALGLWEEAAMLAFLYSISEALEEFTEDRTRGAIRALMDLAPKRVKRLDDAGQATDIAIEDLKSGDRFLVRPGESVATDGEVVDGASSVNESAVTGEAVPVAKAVGSKVFAGTLNAQGALVVEATATEADNTLAKIVQLVTEAQEQKGRSEQFMTRFSRRYSPAVLVLSTTVAVIAGIVTNDWNEALSRAATVLVAAAPCALVISIPVTYIAAMGRGGRRGILIKGGIHLEELAQVEVMALDKTGTITEGNPRLERIETAEGVDADQALRLTAAIEQRSEHPLARAVLDAAHDRQLEVPAVSDFASLTGAGAEATIDGTTYVVGSPALITERNLDLDPFGPVIEQMQDNGATAIALADQDHVLAVLGVADTIRPNAAAAIAEMHRIGVRRVVMLTGDNHRTAAAVARQVGTDEHRADLKPEGKVDAIRQLSNDYGHVAMVGDGINDAPALASAAVGIAMGAAGSDAALETADVALMSDDIAKLPEALQLGRRTRRVVRQNLALSLLILAVLVPGAVLGLLTLPAAVIAHELSELFVISNGARMARGARHDQ